MFILKAPYIFNLCNQWAASRAVWQQSLSTPIHFPVNHSSVSLDFAVVWEYVLTKYQKPGSINELVKN